MGYGGRGIQCMGMFVENGALFTYAMAIIICSEIRIFVIKKQKQKHWKYLCLLIP